MVRVAVAGGTGGLGRAVVEEILATKKHDVFLISRTAEVKAFADDPKVTVLPIDYSSPEAIATVLKSKNIDTIVCTMGIFSDEQQQAQLNLIDGAVQSGTVKRFAPSEFGLDYLQNKKDGVAIPSPAIRDNKVAAVEKLDASPLTYTRFVCGFFLDYFGYPHYPTYLPYMGIVMDIQNGVAAIPGTGEELVTFTLTRDVGKFVAESLELESWEPTSYLVGDKVKLNDMLKWAEAATGKKFDVSYDDVAKLKSYQVTELPSNVPRYAFFPKPMMMGMLAMMGLGMAENHFNFKGPTLNEKLPQVKTTKVKDFLETYWTGK